MDKNDNGLGESPSSSAAAGDHTSPPDSAGIRGGAHDTGAGHDPTGQRSSGGQVAHEATGDDGPREHTLDPAARTVWALRSAMLGLGIVVAGGVAAVLFLAAVGVGIALAGAVAVLVVWSVVLCGVVPAVRLRIWRYVLTPEYVEIVRGILIRKRTMVPMVRIQHADTKQGPLLRHFDLSEVHIYTAASDHVIPAVARDRAEALRRHIIEFAGGSGEDV